MSAWIEQRFDTWAADKGDVIRRNIVDVERFASRRELYAAVKDRDWHLVETGNQFIVICNSGEIKIHC